MLVTLGWFYYLGTGVGTGTETEIKTKTEQTNNWIQKQNKDRLTDNEETKCPMRWIKPWTISLL